MSKFEFYLSEGSLDALIERDSLWATSTNNSLNDCDNVTVSIDSPKPLVQIVKIEHFQSYPNSSIPRYVFELYDGKTNLPVTIDPDKYLSLLDTSNNNDLKGPKIKLGSIIMIHRYKFFNSSNFFSAGELLNECPNKIMCITDLSLVGFSEIHSNKEEFDAKESDEDKNTSNKQIEASHTISTLNPRLSKQQWSIKCRLMEKTLVREFENRTNGSKGRVMRLLLLDKTCQVEMVAFNDHCNNESLNKMQLNKYYIIRNGEIKLAKNNLKSWPDKVSLQFEIHLTNQTEIIQVQREESDSEDANEESDADDDCSDKDEACNSSKNIIKSNSTINTLSHPVLNKKFTLFNELVQKKCESLVDVIGVITEIGELKTIKKNNLSIRNFKMVDKTKTIITFALWGKEAESFNSKVGSVLVINKAKITNYGGLSLSVIRISEIIKIQDNSGNQMANDLYDWWRNKWWQSRSNNQEKQLKKKRNIDDDEVDEHNSLKKAKI